MRQALHTTPRGFTTDTPAPDVALPLGTALAVLEAVSRQFLDAAPSRAAATLVQSVIWLIAAKLEAQATALAERGAPVATPHPSEPVVVHTGHGGPLTWPHPGGEGRQPEPTPSAPLAPAVTSDVHVHRAASVSMPAMAPVNTMSTHPPSVSPQQSPEGGRPTTHSPTPPSREMSVRDRDVTPNSPASAAVPPAAPRRAATRGDNSTAPVSTDRTAPPDEYDGLCAVGARLFAATAVKA